MPRTNTTRRRVLQTGGAALAATVGASGLGTAKNLRSEGDKSFGRVWAGERLWRTNVVRVLEDRPRNEDRIYFLHDGSGAIVANPDVSGQVSPFVSETAPGETDYNGGHWSHFAARVTDLEAFDDATPVDDAEEVLTADFVDVNEEPGRPGFGPPTYFLCPLNGRA